jgi:Polymorphic toxin system, DSP-PTPase phosphatase
MPGFSIASLLVGGGDLGLCPIPGRGGDYAGDLAVLLHWGPGLVLTMTTRDELVPAGARGLGKDLALAGIDWRHLPIVDFGTPGERTAMLWPDASRAAQAVLGQGGRVLVHCFGGCGRSGMAGLRLMIEAGEAPDSALRRLRILRPCAVETEDQLAWAGAASPTPSR